MCVCMYLYTHMYIHKHMYGVRENLFYGIKCALTGAVSKALALLALLFEKADMYVYMRVCIYMCVRASVCVCVCVCVFARVCVRVCL